MGDQGPIFFFHEDDPEWGFLCQWYPSSFKASDGDFVFKTAEQYMMYHKATTFNDEATAKEILLTSSAREAKALGQRITGFDAEKWDTVKVAVVEEGTYWKFTNAVDEETREKLKKRLLDTGDRELVEASHFDRVWGVGFSVQQCRMKKNSPAKRSAWGLNLLGKALMAARDRIRREEEVDGQTE